MRIFIALFFAGIATSASAQVASHCCIQPPLTAADVAQRQAFERAQAESVECKRMHIGCPEGTFTRVMQKSHTR